LLFRLSSRPWRLAAGESEGSHTEQEEELYQKGAWRYAEYTGSHRCPPLARQKCLISQKYRTIAVFCARESAVSIASPLRTRAQDRLGAQQVIGRRHLDVLVAAIHRVNGVTEPFQ